MAASAVEFVSRLEGAIEARTASVGVIGLGYVGLPLAVAFAEAGHEVVGLDADPRKIEALGEGRSYIEDVPSAAVEAASERLRATGRYADLASCHAVIICVPTPLTSSREPDLSHLVDAARHLVWYLNYQISGARDYR